MVKAGDNDISFQEAPPRISEWRRFRRVFFQRKIVFFGLLVLVLLGLAAIFAPWISPYSPYDTNMRNVLLQPSKVHLLGTDPLGRDTLSRLIYGTRTALLVGFTTVTIAAVAGMALGLIAGYFGGVTNMIIMRIMDLLLSFPMIILALFIAALLGGGIQNVIIALGIGALPGYARVMHGLALSIRENDYILAERAMGSSNSRTMFSHILPNTMPPMIVLITIQLGSIILAEAGLSYLGIGIKPPGAAWGAMVNEGYRYLLTNPWLSFAPGLAIMLVVFAFNLVGDGLRDALDPRMRGLL
jgi:peptide/nickel transport system permease protein/oligopeptide transport system permease protein